MCFCFHTDQHAAGLLNPHPAVLSMCTDAKWVPVLAMHAVVWFVSLDSLPRHLCVVRAEEKMNTIDP